MRCNKPLSDSAKFCTTCGAVCADAENDFRPNATEKAPGAQPDGRPAKRAEPAGKTPGTPVRKKRKPAKKGKGGLYILIAAALLIAAAIIVVSTRGCKKPASVPAAALVDTKIESGSDVVSPDGSSARVETPELTGLPLADASAKLAQAGLVADVHEAGYDPAYADSVVTAQSVAAGEWLTKGDHVTLSVNTLPLSLTVLQTSVRSGRITLGNVVEICRTMGTNNPNFDYSIVIHAVEDYEFKGGFRCLVGTGEETPISRVNTQFLRDGTLVNGFESAVGYKDSIVWTFALEDWMGFHFENVTGYDVYLSNRVDTASAVSKSFLPDATKSMALIDCPTNNGRIRVDIPTSSALTIRITDDKLPGGYTNSPNGTGSLAPKWDSKLVMSSYKWISATIDGTGGEAQDAMQATGSKFTKKGGQATTFDGVSYTAEGDVMVISVPIPADMDFDPYAISYIELSFGDGAYTEKIKVQ